VKRILLSLLLAAGTAILAASAAAQTKSLLNIDKTGLAIQGYDAVSFFTQGTPVKGRSEFESRYHGARYQFASPENKSAFDANPGKYEPQFGGFCAYAVSEGHTAPVKIDAFMIVNGRLLMQYDRKVRAMFEKDPQGRLARADQNWPGLVEKEGR